MREAVGDQAGCMSIAPSRVTWNRPLPSAPTVKTFQLPPRLEANARRVPPGLHPGCMSAAVLWVIWRTSLPSAFIVKMS